MADQPSTRRGRISPIIWMVIGIALVAFFLIAVRQPAVAPGPTDPVLTKATAAAAIDTAVQATPISGTQAGTETPPAAEAAAPVPGETPIPTQSNPAAPTRGSPETFNGLPTIERTELPPEALETLVLIEAGGPFPYEKDGSTFQNREGLLPSRPRGYYAEYTVITPGEDDRGARRIVAGEPGEYYYTDDHYASFSYIWIEP